MTMTIHSKTTFSVPPQVMSRLVGDETVLLDLASGMYYGLDGVGRRIWESVAEGYSCEQIAAIVAGEYNVELLQAQEDVVDFLNGLADNGLVSVN